MPNIVQEALNKFARFDTYPIEGLCEINIKKPGIDEIQEFEEFGQSLDESAGAEVIRHQVRKIGLEFMVDAKCKPVFDEKSISALTSAPLEIMLDVIGAFKQTMSKVTDKMEKLQKKH